MTRLCLIWMFIVCLSFYMCIGIAYGQDAFMDSIGATIRGEVFDTSPELRPIEGVTVKIVNNATEQEYIVTTDEDGRYEKTGLPAGRYTISFSKKGYGDRIGSSKVVAAGGEIFERIKMRKKDNILTFFQRGMFGWILVVSFAVGFLLIILALFRSLRRSNV